MILFRLTIHTDAVLHGPSEGGIAPEQAWLVVAAGREVAGQGGAEPVFAAAPGESFRLFVDSESNNFENLVLLEDVRFAGGAEILSNISSGSQSRTVVVPASVAEALPAAFAERPFYFVQGEIAGEGVGSYDVAFAIFYRDETGQPRLQGHYQWAMTLTVRSVDRPRDSSRRQP